MRKQNWFGEVAKSLHDGMFADKIILALARGASEGIGVRPDERKLFKDGADFLEKAIAGYQWMDRPSLSSSSIKDANLFGQAVRALSITSVPGNFIEYLEELKNICGKLAQGESVTKENILNLRKFFLSHSTAEMQYTDQLFSAPKRRSGLAWAS